MSSSSDIKSLSNINQKITSSDSSFPVVTLSSGQKVPTGTVATLLHNIRLYDQAVSDDNKEQKSGLEEEMKAAVPVLGNLGFFGLFSTEEWCAGKSAGRKFVGEVGKEMGF